MIREIGPRDLGAVQVGQVRRDLPGRQPLRRRARSPARRRRSSAAGACGRSSARTTISVARHIDLDLADLGQHRLRPGAVARVALVAALDRVLRIAEVLARAPPRAPSPAPSWSTPSATRPGPPARRPRTAPAQQAPARIPPRPSAQQPHGAGGVVTSDITAPFHRPRASEPGNCI